MASYESKTVPFWRHPLLGDGVSRWEPSGWGLASVSRGQGRRPSTRFFGEFLRCDLYFGHLLESPSAVFGHPLLEPAQKVQSWHRQCLTCGRPDGARHKRPWRAATGRAAVGGFSLKGALPGRHNTVGRVTTSHLRASRQDDGTVPLVCCQGVTDYPRRRNFHGGGFIFARLTVHYHGQDSIRSAEHVQSWPI